MVIRRTLATLLVSTRLAAAATPTPAPDPAFPITAPAPAPAFPTTAPAPPAPAPPPDPTPLPPDAPGPEVRLHHAPVSVTPSRHPFTATASIVHPELVKRAFLVYRTSDNPAIREVEFRRSDPSPYVAIVPASEVLPGWLEYSIELERVDRARSLVFATRTAMHRVQVPEDLADARERALEKRLAGRRSEFFASGDYVNFGTSVAEQAGADGVVELVEVPDDFFRVEAGYTYRPLRVVTEFSLRAGIVRSRAPVPLGADPRPGMNYGAPTVVIRALDWLSLEGEVLTSVTDQGFSMGGGAAVHVGDFYGTKLATGFEAIDNFGARFYSRMEVVASRFLTVVPMLEVTNMPHAEHYGVRLLGELDVEPGAGFSFALRGGYQARVSTAGGPSLGLTLRYAF